MIEAILFDFDGVIVESADIKTEAFRTLYAGNHPDAVDAIVAYHLSNEGISRYDKFRHIQSVILGEPIDEATVQALGVRFSELALDAILAAPFVPGAIEFLEAHLGQLPMFLVSGTPQEELRHIARERGIDKFFQEVHGTPRAKADIIGDVLVRYGLDPEAAVLVGDADSDRRAAEATGVTFIARRAAGSGKVFDVPHVIDDLNALADTIRLVEGRAE